MFTTSRSKVRKPPAAASLLSSLGRAYKRGVPAESGPAATRRALRAAEAAPAPSAAQVL